MTHVPPESKAWPRAGADGRPSPSGEQRGRVGQPVDETSAAAREPGARPGTRRRDDPVPRRGDDTPADAPQGDAHGLAQAPRTEGDGSVQDQPRSPAQRTD